MKASAPSVGRPAQGFGTLRAQKWILAAALVTAISYAFRRLVEPSVTAAPARGGKVAQLLGSGSPPPPLGQWAIAYGAGFLMLSIVSLGAPEVAASLAMLELAGVALTSGTSLLADIGNLEKNAPSSSALAAPTAPSTPAATPAPNIAPNVPTTGTAGQTLQQIAQSRGVPLKDL